MLLAKACSDGVSGRPQAARARKRRRKRRIAARLAAGRGRCEGDFVGELLNNAPLWHFEKMSAPARPLGQTLFCVKK
jgi:hypothetical protein